MKNKNYRRFDFDVSFSRNIVANHCTGTVKLLL